MKAIFNNTVIAEADKEDVIFIEGMWYFPPDSVNKDFLKGSDTKTVCHWKGECNYFDVGQDDLWAKDAAFTYLKPKKGSVDIVKKDFAGYIAFWREVSVSK